MAYKYKYYRKVIPLQYREQFGTTEYKLSLKDISSKHQNLIKSLFEVEFDKIFNRANEFNKSKLKEYLELVYHKAILDLYGLKSDLLNKYIDIKNNELESYNIKEAIDLFYKHHTTNKKTSSGTLKNHKIYSNKLITFFGSDRDINTIQDNELENFKDSLKLGDGSWNNHLAFFKGLFDYLVSKKKIQNNIFVILETKEIEDKEKEPFSKYEVEKIIKSSKNNDVKIATMIQAYTGMRIGEVGPLKKKHIINLDTINIDYLKDTKTKKHNRQIPIHPTLSKFLKEHLKNLKDEDSLFTIASKGLGAKVNLYIQEITKTNKTSHAFRYSFIEHLNYHFQEYSNYIKVLSAHTIKNDMNFNKYNRGQTNWNILKKMINSINYNI